MQPHYIAKVAHEVNAAYCRALGDRTQAPWEQAPEWQQKSAIAGVNMHLANPDSTPEQSHDSWLAQKLAEGWVYGPVKDAEKKEHPCCLPYHELPIEQQVKDYLFKAVVMAIAALPDEAVALAAELTTVRNQYAALLEQAKQIPDQIPNGVAVQYIGTRETYVDRLYGSGLMFGKGQVRNVPGDLARRFLNHSDLFLRYVGEPVGADDTAAVLANVAKERREHELKEIDLSALHLEINNIADFASLAAFAKDRYQLDLVKQHGMVKCQQRLHAHIDQFGGV